MAPPTDRRNSENKTVIINELLSSRSRTPIPVIIIWGVSHDQMTDLARQVCQDEKIKQRLGLSTRIEGINYKTSDLNSIVDYVKQCTTSSSSSSSSSPSQNRIVVLDDWSVEIGDQDVEALQDKLKEDGLCVKAIMITTRDRLVAIPRNIAASPVKSYALLENSMTLFQKTCFTYCSLFPQDYVFDAERLIHIWMAEGFLNHPSNPSTSSDDSNPEAIGRRYLKDLVGRSIFEEVEFDEFGKVRSCGRMQQVMHDISRFMADSRDIIVDREGKNVRDQVRRASFDFRQSFLYEIPAPLLDKAKDLKTLLLFENKSSSDNMSKKVLSKVLKSFKCLCVLDLRGLEIKEVPRSIGELEDLKYLDLSYNKMEKLPSSITKLSRLETLKLFYCYLLKELPKDFKNLAQLKHLDMEGCSGLTCMPRNISKMTSLQTLSAFVASENDSKRGLEELAKLNQLRGHMEILHLERVKGAPEAKYLEMKRLLEHLKLQWHPRNNNVGSEHHLPTLDLLKPNSYLRVLILEHYRGPSLASWLKYNHLRHLVKLSLWDCHGCTRLSTDDQLPGLEILELVGLNNLEYITQNCDHSAVFYSKLKVLYIDRCNRLNSWWQEEPEFQNRPLFASLSELKCPPQLTCMPRYDVKKLSRIDK